MVLLNFLRVNCVWADDVDILRTLKETVYADSITEQLGLLFKQYNVHRVPVTRAVFLLLQQTIGLKMIHIMYVGDVMYLGILYLFFRLFRKGKSISLVYFLPVAVAMLSLANIKNATWAMASIQNIGVQFFVMLTIYALVKNRSIGFVVLAAVLASLTSLTGFISWGLVVLYYLFTKEFKKAAFALLIGVVIYISYKVGMEKAIDQGYFGLLLDFPTNLIHVTVFMGQLFLITAPKLAFKGLFLENVLLVMAMGGVLVYMVREIFQAMKKRFATTDIAAATILYFIFMMVCGVMSLVVILNSEDSFFGRVEIKIPDRYIIHSLIFFNLFYLSVVSRKRGKLILTVGLLVSLAVNIGHAYANVDTFLKRKKLAQVDYFYLNNHDVLYSHLQSEGYYISCASCVDEIFEPLEEKGAVLFSNVRDSFDSVTKYSKRPLTSALNFINEDYYYYKGLTIETNQAAEYFMLRNAENVYILPTYQIRNSPRNVIKEFAYFQQKKQGSILLNKIKAGTYDLLLFSEKDGKYFTSTNYKLTVTGANAFVEVSEDIL
jgi:hypothetical protein